jgi:CBS domain containing-hemolysin-like protein
MEELRALGVRVPDTELGELAGAFVVEMLGRLPRVGDKVELPGGATAEVTGISRRRVTRLRLRGPKEPEPSGEGKPAGGEA